MAEFPQPFPLVGVTPRRLLPPPARCGFLLLLALVFSVSYAVGSAAGPVAPGMRGTGSTGTGGGGDGGTGESGGGVQDMPGMHGSSE
ncbi:hypothetical protein OH768_51320 [Streptomyces sp. NBC_01622]|uniref:hypothetical protein n=1 Tax=Streptomyces sp. NBC_01622 TaxID=2975903 RepID=UPI0038658003|nr:hypothetical protein OH768_51320 [Streptomyces sp. NBC_01622]